jgi:molybdopterin molybdotransferase
MLEFFKLKTIAEVLAMLPEFAALPSETIPLSQAPRRVLAAAITAPEDVPKFTRSTMDGFAVRAQDTFGAGPGTPAFLEVAGEIAMGAEATQAISPGQTQHIATGGMLPPGADAVVMLEYTQELDAQTLEVRRSVSPLENVVQKGEDVGSGTFLFAPGSRLRPQDIGLLAALGITRVPVYSRPKVAIISTGDEIIPLEAELQSGQMRDSNSYTLAAQISAMGGEPWLLGIVPDQLATLQERLTVALGQADVVLLSGGSSVGTRDLAIAALQSFPESQVLVHGVAVSPGKPTILARIGPKPLVGLPGHPVSAMVIMEVLVRPLLARLEGLAETLPVWGKVIEAQLARNLASTPGREDFIRVRLRKEGENLLADPILGKSGLISTMVKAEGWIQIPLHTEGLEKGEVVQVQLFPY